MTLAEWMRAASVTDAAFAERIGVSGVTVHRWRTGKNRPEWRFLPLIEAETAGAVTAADFLPVAEVTA